MNIQEGPSASGAKAQTLPSSKLSELKLRPPKERDENQARKIWVSVLMMNRASEVEWPREWN
jgi:hypothetical protein